MKKFRVYKNDGDWSVELPHIGYTRRTVVFGTHMAALSWAAHQADLLYSSRSLYATATPEAWGPWTVKRPRL